MPQGTSLTAGRRNWCAHTKSNQGFCDIHVRIHVVNNNMHLFISHSHTIEHSTSIEDVDRFIDALKLKVVRTQQLLQCYYQHVQQCIFLWSSMDDIRVWLLQVCSCQLPCRLLTSQFSLHPTSLARCLIESTLRGQPNLRCLEFPSFFASGFIQ